MQELILTNSIERSLKDLLKDFGDKADKIRIASAFFSDTAFINEWQDKSKLIDLLVSLRPPTNYYSLKTIYSKLGVNIQFLGDDFHSKFFIFYKNKIPFSCIIGSSNFTSGGLNKNIETNAILTDMKYLKEVEKHFSTIWDQSYLLQPTDLELFKEVFDNFKERAEQTEKEQRELQHKILTKRITKKKKTHVGKQAKQYFDFWRIVDDVKEMVNDISAKEYPNVPVYIAIDHFWHWVKTVWSEGNNTKLTSTNKKLAIPKLFREYCAWDKENGNYTKQMAKTSKNLTKLLSENNIENLTSPQAMEVYRSLHSGAMRAKRFRSDQLFVQNNSIRKIRKSLKYLLYSNDDLDLRIHNLCVNPDYKLSQLSSSGTQEIIGWVNPKQYPIRNKKADEALKLLGYKLE